MIPVALNIVSRLTRLSPVPHHVVGEDGYKSNDSELTKSSSNSWIMIKDTWKYVPTLELCCVNIEVQVNSDGEQEGKGEGTAGGDGANQFSVTWNFSAFSFSLKLQ